MRSLSELLGRKRPEPGLKTTTAEQDRELLKQRTFHLAGDRLISLANSPQVTSREIRNAYDRLEELMVGDFKSGLQPARLFERYLHMTPLVGIAQIAAERIGDRQLEGELSDRSKEIGESVVGFFNALNRMQDRVEKRSEEK